MNGLRWIPLLLAGTLMCARGEEASASRTWTSTAGSEFEGALVKPGLTEAVLRNPEGRTLVVPLSALAAEDREVVWAQLEKEDVLFRKRRKWFQAREPGEGGGLPVFDEGPWVGAAAVVEGANYRYVLAGDLTGALYLKHLRPDAVDLPIEAMSTTFQHRDPDAADKRDRKSRELTVAAATLEPGLPAVLETSPRGGTEVRMNLEFANGRTGSLTYTFEPDAIRVRARVSGFRQPRDVTSLIVGNLFPPSHEFTGEMELPEIKQLLGSWRVELEPIAEEKDDTTIPWWAGGDGTAVSRLEVVGPWEPWRLTYRGERGEGGREIKFEVYPGFAPYRKGFKVNRFAMEEGEDLVLDWTLELDRR